MTQHILKAIEQVERNAAKATARLETARAQETERATGVADGTTSTLSLVDAEIEEMGRIARLAESARRDYTATYGRRPNADEGEAVA